MGPRSQETKRGTLKFNGGAKVYVVTVFWGVGGERLTAVGRFSGRHGYISASLKTEYLENFRAELIYSPTIIERVLKESERAEDIPTDGSEFSRQKAEQLAELLRQSAEEFVLKRKARSVTLNSKDTNEPENHG